MILGDKISRNLDVQGWNGLDIRNQLEKSNQNDELFPLGFKKVWKMLASILIDFHSKKIGHGMIN